MKTISETDLILNADGSCYHLSLLPEDIAPTIITVGDPDRVGGVSKYFDRIALKKGKREFVTHTGYLGKKRITVVSTGIGTDNIDIVLNELDALVNIDLKTRQPKEKLTSLNIIRIGTSGAVQADIPVNSLLVSASAFGLDPLMHYYRRAITAEEQLFITAFKKALGESLSPYFASAGTDLLAQLAAGLPQGITITAPGFYAPQGRQLRVPEAMPNLMERIMDFQHNGQRITNLEMETAGIYGLASALGHQALSWNVILANRVSQQFSSNPAAVMDRYIKLLLEKISDMAN